MQAFLIIVVVAFLGGGVYYFTQGTEPAPESTSVTGPVVEVTSTNNEPDDSEEVYGEETAVVDSEIDTTVPAEVAGEEVVFNVSGSNFAFDVTEMRVNEGDTVTINFESADGFHDWVVDEFGAATKKVRPGDGVTSVTFVADAVGTYEYYCSVGSHRASGMVGTLIVE